MKIIKLINLIMGYASLLPFVRQHPDNILWVHKWSTLPQLFHDMHNVSWRLWMISFNYCHTHLSALQKTRRVSLKTPLLSRSSRHLVAIMPTITEIVHPTMCRHLWCHQRSMFLHTLPVVRWLCACLRVDHQHNPIHGFALQYHTRMGQLAPTHETFQGWIHN